MTIIISIIAAIYIAYMLQTKLISFTNQLEYRIKAITACVDDYSGRLISGNYHVENFHVKCYVRAVSYCLSSKIRRVETINILMGRELELPLLYPLQLETTVEREIEQLSRLAAVIYRDRQKKTLRRLRAIIVVPKIMPLMVRAVRRAVTFILFKHGRRDSNAEDSGADSQS